MIMLTLFMTQIQEIKTDMFSLKEDKMDKDTTMALIEELRQKCANVSIACPR